MKLKNKKTGEIIDDGYVRETHDFQFDGQKHVLAVFKGNGHRPPERVSGAYNSLAELNEEWEDAPEEPKEFWHILPNGRVINKTDNDNALRQEFIEDCKEFGNYFETKEEAEKAVEKLKAWKRLKDKGFRFTLTPGVGSLDIIPGKFQIEINADMPARWFCCDDVQEDLDDCFGGEDE